MASCFVAVALLGLQTPADSYQLFVTEIIQPTFAPLVNIQYDELQITERRPPYFSRWIRGSNGVVALSDSRTVAVDISSEAFKAAKVTNDSFNEHALLNPDYEATVLFREADSTPILGSVRALNENTRLGGLPAQTEYLTRLSLDRLVGHPFVTIENFRDHPPDKKKLSLRIKRGERSKKPTYVDLILDAHRGHCLEARYTYDGLPWRTTVVTYTELEGGIPFPLEAVTRVHAQKSKPETTERTLFHRVRLLDDVPAERFRLTHYGLPEPGFAKPKGSRIWVWFLVAGGGLILGGKLLSLFRGKTT